MNKCIGIISYFPTNDRDRNLRISYLEDLFSQIDKLFTEIPVLIITQCWGDYIPKFNGKLIRKDFNSALGIIKARKELRKEFLNSDFDYMIMMDDDSVIRGTDASLYLKEIEDNPNGFGWFINHSFLLFGISKNIYSQMELPDVDAEKDEAFEDKLFISMCRIKFPEYETVFTHSDKLREETWQTGGRISTWWTKDHSKHLAETNNRTMSMIADYMKENNNTTFVIPKE